MTLLSTHGLTAFYGSFQALFGVDLRIDAGETLAIIGANGAGKSTLMRALSGILASSPDMIFYDGASVGALTAPEMMAKGIAMVPEGRKLFPSLNVEENLQIGTYGRKTTGPWNLSAIYALFPILHERRLQASTSLSGGQQQMVAIGRALMSNPRLLLCDEISLGLAPVVIKDIYASLPAIKETGTSVIVVEQDITQSLRVANRVICMMEGRITLQGTPDSLTRSAIHNAYFGAHA